MMESNRKRMIDYYIVVNEIVPKEWPFGQNKGIELEFPQNFTLFYDKRDTNIVVMKTQSGQGRTGQY